MSFTLFPIAELRSVTTPELKCLFAMVNRIKYTPVADIVDYFKNVHKMSGPIKCTSMVTQISINLVHVHVLREEPDHYLSMLYGRKVIRLPNPGLRLYSCESLTL
jgi:hypothetical protein